MSESFWGNCKLMGRHSLFLLRFYPNSCFVPCVAVFSNSRTTVVKHTSGERGGGGGWEGVAVPLPKQATQKAGRSLLANLLPPPQRRFFTSTAKEGNRDL